MSHYDNEREKELTIKHDIQDIDISHYTKQMWHDDIKVWLVDVMGMNEAQVKQEFDKRFADLLDLGAEL